MEKTAVFGRRPVLLPLRLSILVVVATTVMGFSAGQPSTNGLHDKNLAAEIKPDGSMYAEHEARGVVANSRGEHHGEFAELRRLPPQERAAAYLRMTEQHRINAQQVAKMVQGSTLPPNTGRKIRAALKADLAAWRVAFAVPRRDWLAMRDQWLLDGDSLTTEQWAHQRANWFAARDAWIARQTQSAKARGQ